MDNRDLRTLRFGGIVNKRVNRFNRDGAETDTSGSFCFLSSESVKKQHARNRKYGVLVGRANHGSFRR